MHALVADVTTAMDAYDLFAACGSVRTFLDALTNWYVRRSRDRFWAGDPAALDALQTVLTTLCQVAAPLLPLTTEAVYRGLVGDDDSVHLTDWPTQCRSRRVAELWSQPWTASATCAARRLRFARRTGRRVRQPLASLTSRPATPNRWQPFRGIIADEVNVKDVVLSTDLDAVGDFELRSCRACSAHASARTCRR